MAEQTKSIEQYLELAYPIELTPSDGGYFASNPDLPGCFAQGDTPNEASSALAQVRRLWITAKIENGLRVPEPVSHEFSGNILLRMSKALHAEVAHLARRRGVSLNLQINTALSEYVGYARAGPARPQGRVASGTEENLADRQ